MNDINEIYRQKRRSACLKLFQSFVLDLNGCRNPEIVTDVLAYAREGYFSSEIAEKVGKSPKAVQKIFRRYNFPVLHNFAPREREEKPNWIGGIHKNPAGYFYTREKNHPNKNKYNERFLLHRLVYEKHHNVILTKKQVIHHIDDNPENNAIENLMLYETNGEHLAETLKGKCPAWTIDGQMSSACALVHRIVKSAKWKRMFPARSRIYV